MSVYRFALDVPIANTWENVERVRGVVQGCFEAVFRDVAGRDAIAMVTGELLENAIKYGDWSDGRGVFRLHVSGDETHSTIAVTNPIADIASADRVREIVEFIDRHETALLAYQARLIQVAASSSTGGLGLVRVAYEGGAELRWSLEDKSLTVTAVRRHHLHAESELGALPA